MINLRRRPILIALLLAGVLLLLSGVVLAQSPPTPPPYDPATVSTPDAPPVAAPGASIYAQNCAPCHGPAGNSDGPTSSSLPQAPPRFADPATIWQRSPAEYFHITKFGNIQNLMPPWGNQLSDGQIWQAVYYAWSLHTNQEMVQQGAERYSQSCAACHGERGAGDGPDAAGSLPDFSNAGAMSLRTQVDLDGGWRAAHPEIGQEWSEDERRTVLDYVRTLSYVPPWESPYRAGAGVIHGTVVQGTPDGGAPSTLPVTLTAFINFEPVQSFTTTTDAEGAFAFEALDTTEGVAYIASTQYAGVQYNSNVYQLEPLTPTATITIPVYETTADGSGVHISRANWLVDFEPGALRVGVILVFSNQSDRTYIGALVEGLNSPATLALAVPPGAEAIEFNDGVLGGRYQQVRDRLYDVVPIGPGQDVRQLIYSYRLPVTGDSAELAQSFLYPVGNLTLLVTDLPNLQVEAPDLTYIGIETLQGTNFRHWSASGLQSPTVPLRLSGLNEAGALDPQASGGDVANAAGVAPAMPPLDPIFAWVMGGLLLAVLAGVLYLPLHRQTAAERVAALTQERDRLITEIAALDDQHAAGQLPTAEWSQARARQKSALMAIAQELSKSRSESSG
jgi:mono/diheme cytochrome c family protein